MATGRELSDPPLPPPAESPPVNSLWSEVGKFDFSDACHAAKLFKDGVLPRRVFRLLMCVVCSLMIYAFGYSML